MDKTKPLRYERLDPCNECEACLDHKRCDPVRMPLRSFGGIRPTSDGFDCALPITIDSHTICSYACAYCFSDNLVQHRANRDRPIGQTSLGQVERLFAGEGGKQAELYRSALHYGKLNEGGYPCPIQLGAICDPCDHIERQQGWLLDYIDLAIKYNQPTRISTKGTVFQLPEYLDKISKAPHLFWVAFSIITPDDELLEKIDLRAPNATERLKTMKMLSDVGVKTSLRFRPIMPGLSDATPKYPEAYRVLIEKAAEAGAIAISYEVGFVSGMQDENVKRRWERLSRITGVPFNDLYRSFGKIQACMRPPHSWTENIMHAIYEEAHKHGMVVGVSDPVWKQLTDTGCCCGILPDDPVFGNWETESATNQLMLAKQDGRELAPKDITPAWAYECALAAMVNIGVGPKVVYTKRHAKWSDKLEEIWNEVNSQRGPLNYFQGALQPIRREDNGDLVYKYVGLNRVYPERVSYWKVPSGMGKDLTSITQYPNGRE